jgi:sirohydrochlorin ferrochelatase
MSDVLVAVAHGSKDPRAAAAVSALTQLAAERAPGLDVRTAFLEHAAPSVPQVLSSVPASSRVTVLPLLLTAAYHSKTDIPRLLARRPVAYGAPLGPHPLLLRALERRLAEDSYGRTAVVLASAGSSDPEANAVVTRMAAHWQRTRGWRAVVPAFASAASPAPAEAVRALRGAGAGRVVVATYLLAPGFFADQVRKTSLAAGADFVSAALGALPEVAEVLLERYAEAVAREARAA